MPGPAGEAGTPHAVQRPQQQPHHPPQADAQAAGAVASHKAAAQLVLLRLLRPKGQQVAVQLGAPALMEADGQQGLIVGERRGRAQASSQR